MIHLQLGQKILLIYISFNKRYHKLIGQMVNFKDIKSNPFYFQVNMRLVNHIQIIKFVFIANFFIDYQG